MNLLLIKNLATFKTKITLIAGSGYIAYETANILNDNGELNKIILLEENKEIKKKFKNITIIFDIKKIEDILNYLKQNNYYRILLIGYVKLPPIKDLKLSIKSKLFLTKNFYLNNISNQSKILKRFIESKKINLISQKRILRNLLIKKTDTIIFDKQNKIDNIFDNINLIKKVFSLSLCQSFLIEGKRLISLEDILGTNDMITRVGKKYKYRENHLTFLKSKKANQLDEIDFPVIGPKTLDLLHKYKIKNICLFEKKIIISQKEKFFEKIYKFKINLLVI